MKEYYVNQNDSIQELINNFPAGSEPITVHLSRGVFCQRVNLKRDNVTFIGDESGETVITYNVSALAINADGEKNGTFRTATFMADCDNFKALNITFENSAGQGEVSGQCIALYADGKHQIYEHCRMLGCQDTVFLAPLPDKEKQPGGFRGEKEFAPRRDSDMLFSNCYIEGNVDYIFGGATAWFEGCTIFTKKRAGGHKECWVTAASTGKHKQYGFVFHHCKFESDINEPVVYLGRPWRENAKTHIIECELCNAIHPDGWQDWGKPHGEFVYAEGENFGEGACKERVDYAILLSDMETRDITREKVLGW